MEQNGYLSKSGQNAEKNREERKAARRARKIHFNLRNNLSFLWQKIHFYLRAKSIFFVQNYFTDYFTDYLKMLSNFQRQFIRRKMHPDLEASGFFRPDLVTPYFERPNFVR